MREKTDRQTGRIEDDRAGPIRKHVALETGK